MAKDIQMANNMPVTMMTIMVMAMLFRATCDHIGGEKLP